MTDEPITAITEVVRECYVLHRIQLGHRRAEATDEFNRWLLDVKAGTLEFAAEQIRRDETGLVAQWLNDTADYYRASFLAEPPTVNPDWAKERQ